CQGALRHGSAGVADLIPRERLAVQRYLMDRWLLNSCRERHVRNGERHGRKWLEGGQSQHPRSQRQVLGWLSLQQRGGDIPPSYRSIDVELRLQSSDRGQLHHPRTC